MTVPETGNSEGNTVNAVDNDAERLTLLARCLVEKLSSSFGLFLSAELPAR
jgi:hypothetical protein